MTVGGLLTRCVAWWTCGSRGTNLFIGARNVSLIVLAGTVRSGLGTGSMLCKSDVTSVRVADCIPASFFSFLFTHGGSLAGSPFWTLREAVCPFLF